MPVEFWTAGPMQYAVAQGAGTPLTQALASDQTCTDIDTDQNSPLDSVPHVSVNMQPLAPSNAIKIAFCVFCFTSGPVVASQDLHMGRDERQART